MPDEINTPNVYSYASLSSEAYQRLLSQLDLHRSSAIVQIREDLPTNQPETHDLPFDPLEQPVIRRRRRGFIITPESLENEISLSPSEPEITFTSAPIRWDLPKGYFRKTLKQKTYLNIIKSMNKDELYEEIKKVFKYIPIDKHEELVGFYDHENNIFYKKVEKYKNRSEESTILFVPEKIKLSFDDFKDYVSIEIINDFCKIKVISILDSVSEFKYKDRKKALIGKDLTIHTINIQEKYGNKDKVYNSIILFDSNSENPLKTRFLMSDIKIVYPNLKGYNKPKERDIKTGVDIVFKKDFKQSGIQKGYKAKVLISRNIGNKVYSDISFNKKIITVNNNLLKRI